MRCIIAAIMLVVSLPAFGAAETRPSLAAKFARALVALDMGGLDAIATHPIRYVTAWNSLTTLVTSSRCLDLRSEPRVDMIGSGLSLHARVTVDALVTGARSGKVRTVPRSWI